MTYRYERPKGKHYKVSIKEWNKVFANRGRWPFVVANVYVDKDVAITHYNISLFCKIFVLTISPIYYIVGTILSGCDDAHESFLDIIFDKERGGFSSDATYKSHEVSWNKLMKLIGVRNEINR